MPLPKPKSDEPKKDFLSRCMANDTMQEEFPDDDQRFAVCQQQWKDKDKKTMRPSKELRFISFDAFELREDDDQPKLVGYASIFNQEAVIFGLWREKVAPGTFKKTIKEPDIRALWNHNTALPLGRNRAKPPTLSLSEDDKGLFVEITPPDTQAGRDAVTSIKRGDVTQMSIAFQLVLPADHGLELTNEQREIIHAAVELYQPYLLEPEPVEDDHSSLPEAEPEVDHWEYH